MIGIPGLLAVTIGNPLRGWPDLAAGDLSDTALIDVLAAVAYVAWAQFAIAVLIEAIAATTRVRIPDQLPVVFSGQRRLAHALITAAFLLANGASIASPALSPQAVVASVAVAPNAGTSQPPKSVAASSHGVAAEQVSTYTIRADSPGTFWDLADHFLGNGQRWPEIWQLNEGRQQHDGVVMTSPGLLRPGWTVALPIDLQDKAAPANGVSTRTSGAPTHSPRDGTVTVLRGDSLWSISEAHLGDGNAWPHLYRLNQGRLQPDGGRLTDPDLIQPGWILSLPDQPASQPQPPPSHRRPSEPSASPTSAPAPSQHGLPTPSSSTITEAASPSVASVATPSAEATPTNRQVERGPSAGVELPGGWVGLPLAAAISGAAAMVWVRRRRRHRYLPLWSNPGEDRDSGDPSYVDDEDLQPLPAVVDRLRRTIRQQAPTLLEPVPAPSTVSEHIARQSLVSPPAVGPSGLELADLSELVPDRGLGLIGAGADSAARGLLVAALTSGGTHDPDVQGEVVVPEATLRRLLASDAGPVKDLQRLCVTPDLDEAIAEIEAIILRRQRLLDEHDAADIAALRADPTNPPMPQLVLLADVPTGEQAAQRLIALLEQGPSTNSAAVFLGDWPSGSTATIEADGRTTAGDGKPGSIRVAVLDQPTTAQLLGVIAEAEPDRADDSSPEGETDGDLDEPPTLNHEPVVPQGMNAAKVRIRLFGKVAVLDDEGLPVPGLRQNAGTLLIYLALHRKGADKNDILEAIWPDAPLRRAAERLSTEVGNLRRCIRLALPDQSAQAVVNTGGRYHLNTDVVDVDLWHLEDAMGAAVAASDPAERVHLLQVVVSAPVLELARGQDHNWLEPVREQLRRKAIRAHTQLADQIAPEDGAMAAQLTLRAAALDATNEELSRRAITALARAGDDAAIDTELSRLRVALLEIDEVPSHETLAMAKSYKRVV
ncbi:LysM peptidoglycan-binding domain-containing protein [Kineosporia sp. R_H_3]|uniref:LysM peptidoglycan-binding domain-containing protein n=1 Tax=Kineosporia sp. R_H_3 TaxID=1961848 RepID=UPI0013041977|nr:LysM peptidoglycan-binding domain-containing protein [Kineosporia sp. R_H_3]